MSNYNNLKSSINNNIYENQTQQITGTVLNAILNEMTNALGAGYQFAGVATVGMTPSEPDARIFYLAGEGIYTSFDGIQVPAGKLGILKWDNRWHLETIDGLGSGGANLTGYVTVASTDDLPDEGVATLGYLCGENLYLYVGEGGDTKEGKYQNCGSFRGPQGDSVQDVEQTQTSLENGGVNKIKFTLSNGISCEFQVRNGTTSSGLFPNLAALQAAYPSPVVGQYAFVGSGFPADIYVCTTAGTWSDSGEDYDGDNVDLTDYATKAEVSALDLEVSRLAGRFYGVFEDDSDLPDDATSVGYAFVGENEPFAIWNFNGTAWSDSGAEAVGLQGPQGNSGYTGAVGELEVVNNLVDGGATAALSAEAGKLLDRNIQLLYDSLGAAAFWGEKPVIDWSGNSVPVSLTLTNCTIDNIASSVPLGDSYEATVTPDAGNILASVVCTMNGEPQAVVNGVISIAEVTGAIVISAMGANLDTVVYDGKSYKQIFETNNALGINPGFDNGSYSPLVVNAGSPAVTSEEHDSGNYCLKASGTSSAQLKTSSTKSGAAFIACRVKVTSYTAGSCGCQFDLTAGVNRVTNGWETAYQNRTSSAAITAYVGSFSSANLTGYVDTPVVILKSTFSSVPTFDKFKELYDQYVAIKKAS